MQTPHVALTAPFQEEFWEHAVLFGMIAFVYLVAGYYRWQALMERDTSGIMAYYAGTGLYGLYHIGMGLHLVFWPLAAAVSLAFALLRWAKPVITQPERIRH